MATANISPSQDAIITGPGFQTVFANARNAGTGTTLFVNPSDGTHAQWQQSGAGTGTVVGSQLKTNSYTFFGSTLFSIQRCFYDFSFSGLPANSTITALNFKLFGDNGASYTNDLGVPVLVKGTFDSSLATADYDSIDNWSSGTGTPTAYSSVPAMSAGNWDESDYNTMALNSTAVSDANSAYAAGERLKIVAMEHELDYSNSAPASTAAGNQREVSWFSLTDAEEIRPVLEVTYEVAAVVTSGMNLNSGQEILKGGNLIIK